MPKILDVHLDICGKLIDDCFQAKTNKTYRSEKKRRAYKNCFLTYLTLLCLFTKLHGLSLNYNENEDNSLSLCVVSVEKVFTPTHTLLITFPKFTRNSSCIPYPWTACRTRKKFVVLDRWRSFSTHHRMCNAFLPFLCACQQVIMAEKSKYLVTAVRVFLRGRKIGGRSCRRVTKTAAYQLLERVSESILQCGTCLEQEN